MKPPRHPDGLASATTNGTAPAPAVRLDKWLWVARFFKTRSLACDDISCGRVRVNGQPAKPSRDVRVGDRVELSQPGFKRVVLVQALSLQRGPASVAQALYTETADSLAARAEAAEARRLGVEPAQAYLAGRPTKRDRRDLADWQRWSASADGDDPPRRR